MTLQTLADIRNAVAARGQWTDSDFQSEIDDAINLVYHDILNRRNWPDLQASRSWTASAQECSLPLDAKLIKRIEDTSQGIAVRAVGAQELAERYNTGLSLSGGAPQAYARIGARAVHTQPESGVLRLSSGSGDVGTVVQIEGYLDGFPVSESVELNGTNSVPTVNSFDEIIRIAKSEVTSGHVTIDDSGAIEVSKLPSHLKTVDYEWVRFDTNPSGRVYQLHYLRNAPDLSNEQDTPILRGCQYLLVMGAYVEILKNQRQFDKSRVQQRSFEIAFDDYAFQAQSGDGSVQLIPDARWLSEITNG